MLAPTCNFQIEYPRIAERRWGKIISFSAGHLVSLFVMAFVFFQHIIPKCKAGLVHFELNDYPMMISTLFGLATPCTYLWMGIFFWLLHTWMNFWAEITRFADRRFYSDWWNAGNLSEFWRKWNYPIHHWLVRHCYYPLIRKGVSSDVARTMTFVLSAVFHEYVIIGIFRSVRFYAFFAMVVCIPLINL